MKLSNRWNTIIYLLWSPWYDLLDRFFFLPGRRRAMRLAALNPGERILLLGVGTGVDIPFLPEGSQVVGIDLSPAMLAKAKDKIRRSRASVELRLGDAQALDIVADSFDVVILNLILSVVPDGAACFREAVRVVKPGGRILVFDKFLPMGGALSVRRKMMNVLTTLAGTDINRRWEDISEGCGVREAIREPSLMGGVYQILILIKL